MYIWASNSVKISMDFFTVSSPENFSNLRCVYRPLIREDLLKLVLIIIKLKSKYLPIKTALPNNGLQQHPLIAEFGIKRNSNSE